MNTLNEVIEWARGYVLIAIGKGEYDMSIWRVAQASWQLGFEQGKKEGKSPSKRTKRRSAEDASKE